MRPSFSSFVNAIKKTDDDRDVLVSYVHLSKKGNRMVAEAFAEEIMKYNWQYSVTTK